MTNDSRLDAFLERVRRAVSVQSGGQIPSPTKSAIT
jgi:hypothetical protein